MLKSTSTVMTSNIRDILRHNSTVTHRFKNTTTSLNPGVVMSWDTCLMRQHIQQADPSIHFLIHQTPFWNQVAYFCWPFDLFPAFFCKGFVGNQKAHRNCEERFTVQSDSEHRISVMGERSTCATLYELNPCHQLFDAVWSFHTAATDRPADPHFSSKVLMYCSVFPEMRTPVEFEDEKNHWEVSKPGGWSPEWWKQGEIKREDWSPC